MVAAVRGDGCYRAGWELVVGNWRGAYGEMVAEMGRRGIDCGGAAPVWCWPGRAWRRGAVRTSARMLLGDHEWAHGRWLLRLDVPDEVTLATSYAVWNEYLGYATGFQDQPERMDWSGRKTWEFDEIQVCVPELRREWVVGARPYPPEADIVARIEADPLLRERYSPMREGWWRRSVRERLRR